MSEISTQDRLDSALNLISVDEEWEWSLRYVSVSDQGIKTAVESEKAVDLLELWVNWEKTRSQLPETEQRASDGRVVKVVPGNVWYGAMQSFLMGFFPENAKPISMGSCHKIMKMIEEKLSEILGNSDGSPRSQTPMESGPVGGKAMDPLTEEELQSSDGTEWESYQKEIFGSMGAQ